MAGFVARAFQTGLKSEHLDILHLPLQFNPMALKDIHWTRMDSHFIRMLSPLRNTLGSQIGYRAKIIQHPLTYSAADI